MIVYIISGLKILWKQGEKRLSGDTERNATTGEVQPQSFKSNKVNNLIGY